jgi:tetratricopeptide (TPR) repeat protein
LGIRAYLTVDSCFQITSNNCIPVTWFALFRDGDLHPETVRDGYEQYETILYKTTAKRALTRIKSIVPSLEDKSPVWSFLRPIEILRDEISQCPTDSTITLDVTQFWFYDESMQQQLKDAPRNFSQFVSALTGNMSHDIALLDELISLYNLAQFSSMLNYPVDSLVFLLFGSLSGRGEEKYSHEHFSEEFWALPDDPESKARAREVSLEVEFSELERERCIQDLRFYKRPPPEGWSDLNAAVCLTRLQDYKHARSYYRSALKRFLKYRTDHFLVTQLLHSYMLADQPRLFSSVRLRTEAMMERDGHLIPAYHYALSVLGLLGGESTNISGHAAELLKAQDSEYRSIGASVVALVDRDLDAFEDGLIGVIVSHHRKLKSGVIRGEYICLPAMTLTILGLSVRMETGIESKYLSKGYLDFLHKR